MFKQWKSSKLFMSQHLDKECGNPVGERQREWEKLCVYVHVRQVNHFSHQKHSGVTSSSSAQIPVTFTGSLHTIQVIGWWSNMVNVWTLHREPPPFHRQYSGVFKVGIWTHPLPANTHSPPYGTQYHSIKGCKSYTGSKGPVCSRQIAIERAYLKLGIKDVQFNWETHTVFSTFIINNTDPGQTYRKRTWNPRLHTRSCMNWCGKSLLYMVGLKLLPPLIFAVYHYTWSTD